MIAWAIVGLAQIVACGLFYRWGYVAGTDDTRQRLLGPSAERRRG